MKSRADAIDFMRGIVAALATPEGRSLAREIRRIFDAIEAEAEEGQTEAARWLARGRARRGGKGGDK